MIRIISGTAKGADKLGEQFARTSGYLLSEFPAQWNEYGKRAGYIRNEKMAEFAIENDNIGALIAFWDGTSKGTNYMINIAKKKCLETFIINF